MKTPLAAISFLTVLPLGRWTRITDADVARAGAAFPLVGFAIGAGVGALAQAMSDTGMTPLLAGALAIAAGALATGALHLDALADTADALGARNRQEALAIMRDPTIGSFGATALVLTVLVKAAALTELVESHNAVRCAALAGCLSRLAPVLLAWRLTYTRAAGAGAAFARTGAISAAVATATAFAIAIAVGGLAVAAGAVAFTAVIGATYRRWLGGVTGDMLGAALELLETTALVALAR